MRNLFLLAVLSVTAAGGRATDVSGDQFGTWTLAGSPYYPVGNVRVPPGQTLVIEPGVQVIGKGYYRILVDTGTLNTEGSLSQPILMTEQA